MNTRLIKFMEEEGLSAAKLAEILSVQPSTISHLLSGRNKPNFEFIARLIRMFPLLNPYWIINGEGDMYNLGAGGGCMTPGGDNNDCVYKCKQRDTLGGVVLHDASTHEELSLVTSVNHELCFEQNDDPKLPENSANLNELPVEEKQVEVNCDTKGNLNAFKTESLLSGTPLSVPQNNPLLDGEIDSLVALHKDGTFSVFKRRKD